MTKRTVHKSGEMVPFCSHDRKPHVNLSKFNFLLQLNICSKDFEKPNWIFGKWDVF